MSIPIFVPSSSSLPPLHLTLGWDGPAAPAPSQQRTPKLCPWFCSRFFAASAGH